MRESHAAIDHRINLRAGQKGERGVDDDLDGIREVSDPGGSREIYTYGDTGTFS